MDLTKRRDNFNQPYGFDYNNYKHEPAENMVQLVDPYKFEMDSPGASSYQSYQSYRKENAWGEHQLLEGAYGYGNPQLYGNPQSQPENPLPKPSPKITRNQKNIELLQKRFSGLRSYKAKAALTLADHDLDRATVLLEVCSAYRGFPARSDDNNTTYLKNIHIDLLYENGPNPPLSPNVDIENVCVEKFKQHLNAGKSVADMEEEQSNICVFSGVTPSRIGNKVGVLISKTSGVYTSSTL